MERKVYIIYLLKYKQGLQIKLDLLMELILMGKKNPKSSLLNFSRKNHLEYVFSKQGCITDTLSNSLFGCSTPL